MTMKAKLSTKEVFDAANLANELCDRYWELSKTAESEKEKDRLEEVSDHFLDIFDRLLKLDKYSDDDYDGEICVLKDLEGELKSYTRITVLRHYEDGYTLVNDTANEYHLIKTENIRR